MIEIREIFTEIQQEFPQLRMEYQPPSAADDLCLEIPEQPGLAFPVHLAHQGEELHLAAGIFFMEWYPVYDEDVVMSYRDAVVGLLGGRYRIAEHYRAGYAADARLQRANGERWETLGFWCNLWGLLSWGRGEERILRNAPHG